MVLLHRAGTGGRGKVVEANGAVQVAECRTLCVILRVSASRKLSDSLSSLTKDC